MSEQTKQVVLADRAVFLDRLERVLSLEANGCPESMVQVLCQNSAVLWADTDQNDKYLFIIKAAQIYSFFETEISGPNGEKIRKWRITRIPDENGVLPEYALSWKQFCTDHLRIHPSEATALKRIWEIYRIQIGYGFDDLIKAGKSKLATAVGTVAQLLPGTHEGLMEALFGNDHKCRFCSEIVDFGTNVPLSCPKCGSEWIPKAPGTLAEVILIINGIKKLQSELAGEGDGTGDPKPKTEGSWTWDKESMETTWIGYLVVGDRRQPLPSWTIRVFDEGDVIPDGETGVYMAQLTELRDAISRGLKQD